MITFTTRAADKAAAIILKDGTPNLHLRIGVKGGGCSGFMYDFTLDDQINIDDTLMTAATSDGNPVSILIDSISYTYLDNAQIDFTEGITGNFSIYNPSAISTCGCGSSFSIEED